MSSKHLEYINPHHFQNTLTNITKCVAYVHIPFFNFPCHFNYTQTQGCNALNRPISAYFFHCFQTNFSEKILYIFCWSYNLIKPLLHSPNEAEFISVNILINHLLMGITPAFSNLAWVRYLGRILSHYLPLATCGTLAQTRNILLVCLPFDFNSTPVKVFGCIDR